MGKNLILDKSFDFAIRILHLNKYLVSEKKEYILSKQVLRSETSVGAMVRETQHAESNADFIHKLSIALKEANETDYWLLLLNRTEYIKEKIYQSLNYNIQDPPKLLVSIIKSSKNKK